MNQPVEGVDARTDRVAQGLVGLAMLTAFVFRVPWIVPVLAVILGIGALAGPNANALHIVIERWLTPRLPGDPTSEARVPVATVRAQDALAAAILVVAGSAFVLGIGLIGWLLAIAEAVIAIIAATTGLHVADLVARRF